MTIDDIEKIELEITSNCNAACPGCIRTQHPERLEINSFGLDELKRLFPDSRHIKGKQFKFCGVLGDPAFNSECLEMVEYLTSHNGFCQLSTNGGIQPVAWWTKLGEISKTTKLVEVVFAVDGHAETNHIYRVNTVFKTIERNMTAYSEAGGKGTWMFIVFDHNEHELDKAQDHAKQLGFKFATRTGMRNSLETWIAAIKKKDKNTNTVVKETVTITTTGKKEHSKKEQVKKLEQFIENKDESKKTEIIKSITCKLVHENEIFIASDLSVWPCCFLWDTKFKGSENINSKLSEYGNDWNSLKNKSLNDVLAHEWFQKILEDSWDPAHNKHISRCIKTCGYKKAYQNEINFK